MTQTGYWKYLMSKNFVRNIQFSPNPIHYGKRINMCFELDQELHNGQAIEEATSYLQKSPRRLQENGNNAKKCRISESSEKNRNLFCQYKTFG